MLALRRLALTTSTTADPSTASRHRAVVMGRHSPSRGHSVVQESSPEADNSWHSLTDQFLGNAC